MVDEIGMFFLDNNILCIQKGNAFGERLAKIAKEKNMLLMACDQCAVRRGFAEGTFEQCGSGDVKPKGMVDGVQVGCFPQLYQALGSNPPDQVITLWTPKFKQYFKRIIKWVFFGLIALKR